MNDEPKVSKGRLFPDGYWIRPPLSQRKVGDASDIQVFAAIGRALTSWEQSQAILNGIVLRMIEAQSMSTLQAVSRLLGSIENVTGRIKAIESVAEVYFGPCWKLAEVRNPLKYLLEEIKRASFVRNEIAHGKISSSTRISSDENNSRIESFSGFLLIAPDYMTGRNSLSIGGQYDADDMFSTNLSLYRLNSNDIQIFAAKFDSINGKYLIIFLLSRRTIN